MTFNWSIFTHWLERVLGIREGGLVEHPTKLIYEVTSNERYVENFPTVEHRITDRHERERQRLRQLGFDLNRPINRYERSLVTVYEQGKAAQPTVSDWYRNAEGITD